MNNELDIVKIILESGLVVKTVLLILLGASVLSWTIAFKKRKFVKLLEDDNKKFDELYHSGVSLGEIDKSIETFKFSPYAKMFSYGYTELKKLTSKLSEIGESNLHGYFNESGIGIIDRGLERGMLETREEFSFGQTWLANVGSVTPYIGLFGTVWGIISSFQGLSQGGGSLESVAPGIAEALVATAIGLFAAIPAVLFFNSYSSKMDLWDERMDGFRKEFLNMVQRSVLQKKGGK